MYDSALTAYLNVELHELFSELYPGYYVTVKCLSSAITDPLLCLDFLPNPSGSALAKLFLQKRRVYNKELGYLDWVDCNGYHRFTKVKPSATTLANDITASDMAQAVNYLMAP
jgi:hypothetical protein